jgi:hypothetical protein
MAEQVVHMVGVEEEHLGEVEVLVAPVLEVVVVD